MIRITTLFIGLLLFDVSNVNADVLFSNLGPGDSYSQTTSLVVGNNSFGNYLEQGGAFSHIPGSFYLTSIDAPVRMNDSDFTLTVYRDNGQGLPGEILETATNFLVAENYRMHTFNFSGTKVLEDGALYHVVASTLNDGVSLGGWRQNSTGYAGDRISRTNGGEWQSSATTFFPAFRVNGESVPEPGSSVFFVAALGCLTFNRKRRR